MVAYTATPPIATLLTALEENKHENKIYYIFMLLHML